MHWVLQHNLFNEDGFDKLVAALNRFAISHSVHKVVPFIGTLVPVDGPELEDYESYADPKLAKLKDKWPVICVGSYSMRHAARKYGWTPGVFDLMESGSYEKCLAGWGEHMLNHDSVVAPFKDMPWWADDEERFVRPCDDSKHFAGRLFSGEEFRNWQANVCKLGIDYGTTLTGETLIQAAFPKKIYTEFRCFVVKGVIVTMSLYKRGDKVMYHNMDNPLGDEAREFATERIREWMPHETFVIDVCETDEGWRVVECNTLNSCGFYKADVTALVIKLEEAYDPMYSEHR